jgi:anti-sigma regulatory factor (Ser/Thr protein kinase)
MERVIAFLEQMEKKWNLPAALIPSINLVLEEALTNVIFYAYEEDTENEIEVDFELKDKQLILVITDSGKPFDPTKKSEPDINLSAEDRPIGGLGIFLIKQVMDEVSYQRNGKFNQLTMLKNWQ